MTAVFKDVNGVKRNFLWQYDKGQTLIIENLDYKVSPEVHFETSSSKEALVGSASFENGTLKVAIPDALLLEARKITVYLYVESSIIGETVKTIDIYVRPRKKPNDYIYTDGMYIISLESIRSAVDTYIDENKIMIHDIVVDYTTVTLTDDTTNISYMVGVDNGKLYIKEVS